MAEESLNKRKYVFIKSPKHYEIAPCSCGNHNTQWSEFEGHIWCDNCQKDFKPIHSGILGTPIPINIAQSLGISFDRVNLETEELEIFMENIYVPIIDLNKNSIHQKFNFKLFFNQYENSIIVPGYFNNEKIVLEDISKMESYYKYHLLLGILDDKIRKWNIVVIKQNKKLHFKFQDKESQISFYAWLLESKLTSKPVMNNKQKI